MRTFDCSYTCSCGNRVKWKGTWETLCVENELETIRIRVDNRIFDTVLAVSECGDFLCIPSEGIGFATDSLSDRVYMEEHLIQELDRKSAVTIAAALQDLAENRRI